MILDGWKKNTKIFSPDVDVKIVDDKGSSFIVSITTFDTPTDLTAKEQMEDVSNKEIEEIYGAVHGKTTVIKRGVTYIDSKQFYYLHFYTPFKNGLRLYHKQYTYSEGNRIMNISAASIENYEKQTSGYFSIMLSTFKFSNLKNK